MAQPGLLRTRHTKLPCMTAVDAAYQDPRLRAAWDEIDRLITAPGWSNALGQKLVQLTMPGVPDIYQGTELWEDSLVDPDNRRLGRLRRPRCGCSPRSGTVRPRSTKRARSKLWITAAGTSATPEPARVLQRLPTARRARTRSDHLIGFDRGGAITLATRLPVGLDASGGWRRYRRGNPRAYVDACFH